MVEGILLVINFVFVIYKVPKLTQTTPGVDRRLSNWFHCVVWAGTTVVCVELFGDIAGVVTAPPSMIIIAIMMAILNLFVDVLLIHFRQE